MSRIMGILRTTQCKGRPSEHGTSFARMQVGATARPNLHRRPTPPCTAVQAHLSSTRRRRSLDHHLWLHVWHWKSHTGKPVRKPGKLSMEVDTDPCRRRLGSTLAPTRIWARRKSTAPVRQPHPHCIPSKAPLLWCQSPHAARPHLLQAVHAKGGQTPRFRAVKLVFTLVLHCYARIVASRVFFRCGLILGPSRLLLFWKQPRHDGVAAQSPLPDIPVHAGTGPTCCTNPVRLMCKFNMRGLFGKLYQAGDVAGELGPRPKRLRGLRSGRPAWCHANEIAGAHSHALPLPGLHSASTTNACGSWFRLWACM